MEIEMVASGLNAGGGPLDIEFVSIGSVLLNGEKSYGGWIPVGVSICQPPIVIPSIVEQRSKNQKKPHGTTTPPSICFGDGTGVVIAMMPARAPDDEDEAESAVMLVGVMTVVLPSENVVVIDVVMPVDRTRVPSVFDITVWPLELVLVVADPSL